MAKLADVFKAKVKKCGHCRDIKPIEAFAFKNKKRGTRHSICKECKNTYLKSYYKDNKEKIMDQRKELREKRQRFKERMRKEYSDSD